jgi:hypothetical protein
MKRFIIIYLVLSTVIISSCGNLSRKSAVNSGLQSSDTGTATAGISFREYQHDFGKVAEGEKVGYTFMFTNKGTTNLVILTATTSCGCTVPKYDTNPIAPGGTGNLEVVFDTSGRNGMQTKIITVGSNALTREVLLKITADVISSE